VEEGERRTHEIGHEVVRAEHIPADLPCGVNKSSERNDKPNIR